MELDRIRISYDFRYPPLASDTSWVAANTFTRPGTIGILYYVYAKMHTVVFNRIKYVFADEELTITAPGPICYDGTPFTITISGTVDPAVVGAHVQY
jgi:hypothetical protein